jgi:radical SAM protein with 4Fe4S-binding SPASM domain
MKIFAKKVINRVLKKRSDISQTRPTQAVIETTNRCNLNCPFCLVGMQNELQEKYGNSAHDLMQRPMGYMSKETFERIREQIKIFGIKKVYLHFQGEPFLNRATPDFAEQLKSDGTYVGVFTNGQAFSNKLIEEIAEKEIDLIRFSVDGASEESYQKNRVGGKFERVLKNMKKIVAAHQGKRTRIEWQFLPMKNNEHEVETAKRLAKEIGVNFFLKGFRETDSELVPVNEAYRSKFLKKPCSDIYKQLGFYWNGDVVPCCYDVEGKEIMGNIMDEDLNSIWESEKYASFRKRVDDFFQQSTDEPAICKTCLRWK